MRIIFKLFVFIAKNALMLLLRMLVSLLPLVYRALRRLFVLMDFSLKALVTGPGQFIDELASEWTLILRNKGLSSEHLDNAKRFCRFWATFLVVLGWLVTGLFLVAILRIVFGFFT